MASILKRLLFATFMTAAVLGCSEGSVDSNDAGDADVIWDAGDPGGSDDAGGDDAGGDEAPLSGI